MVPEGKKTSTTLMASNRGNWISEENPKMQSDHAPSVNPITLVERARNPTQGQSLWCQGTRRRAETRDPNTPSTRLGNQAGQRATVT